MDRAPAPTEEPMTDRIEPALTPEEWEEARTKGPLRPDADDWYQFTMSGRPSAGHAVKSIAVLNDALPADDQRKITRQRLWDLREVAALARDALAPYGPEATWGTVPRTLSAMIRRVEAFELALESYLPPE
jgi:hypothetical protein